MIDALTFERLGYRNRLAVTNDPTQIASYNDSIATIDELLAPYEQSPVVVDDAPTKTRGRGKAAPVETTVDTTPALETTEG